MEQRDFFISYTNSDEAWARWIADVLKSNGYTVYVQALDIKPGDNFLEKMNEFLKHSRNFIAVWSERYPKSRFCMAELQSAFYAWNKETMDCLLPVRIDNHPLEPLYAGLVYVNLSDMGAASETKLINAVRDAVPLPVAPPVTLSAPSPIALTEKEYAEILYQRGDDYYYGDNGVTQDYARARHWYEQAAKKGSTDALNDLGELYRHGLGVPQDYAKARDYYEQAAEKGDETAFYNLGELYEYGKGVSAPG